MKLFVSPHNDDETLFGAFTILREKPLVVIVFDSYVQWNRGLKVTAIERQLETKAAMNILGVQVEFLGFRDDMPVGELDIAYKLEQYKAEEIFLPAYEEDGHHHHNTVAEVTRVMQGNFRSYLTYTTKGKSISAHPVPLFDPKWIALKHRAMACYESQMSLDSRMGCWPHFMRSISEYYV